MFSFVNFLMKSDVIVMFCKQTTVQFFDHCCFKVSQQTKTAIKNHNLNNIIRWQKHILQFLCIVGFGARFDSSISQKTWSHDTFAKEQFKFLTVFVAKLTRQQCTPWNMGSNQPMTTLKANADEHHGGVVCCTFQKKSENVWNPL